MLCNRCREHQLLSRQLQLTGLPICSFVWALVHSPDPAHVERGLDLAQSMIKAGELQQQGLNDLVYLCAVVCNKQAVRA